MDHNLTFYEAILLFGPGYADILKHPNFNEAQTQWFYHVFSPLTDYAFSYGKQTFTSLEWGDSETIVGSVLSNGGSLPRAATPLTDNQVEFLNIVQMAHEKRGGTTHCLFMHAPLVNYDAKKPLMTDESCLINCSVHWKIQHAELFDCGSIQKNRYFLYKYFVHEKRLTHVFSGHSHRAALYECVGLKDESQTSYDDYLAKMRKYEYSTPTPPNKRGKPLPCSKMRVKAHFLPEARYPSMLMEDRARLIVSSSGGPIGITNKKGTLGGMELAPPSGSTLTFVDGEEKLLVVTARNKTAKPRFAVALDYFDVVHKGKNKQGVFKSFESRDLYDEGFIIQLDDAMPKADFIQHIELCLVREDQPVQYLGGELYPINKHQTKLINTFVDLKGCYPGYQFKLDEPSEISKLKVEDKIIFIFLLINLKRPVPFPSGDDLDWGYLSNYDYSSPWIIRIDIQKKNKGMISIKRKSPGGTEVQFDDYKPFSVKSWEAS